MDVARDILRSFRVVAVGIGPTGGTSLCTGAQAELVDSGEHTYLRLWRGAVALGV
jgi:hypothetical protein